MDYQAALLVWFSDGTQPKVRVFETAHVKQNNEDGNRCYACDSINSKHECLDARVKPRDWLPTSFDVDTLCLDTPTIHNNAHAYDAVESGLGSDSPLGNEILSYM